MVNKANVFNCFCFKTQQSATITNSNSDEKTQDEGHDAISKYTGHFGRWNFVWAFILSMYQMTVGFQVFAFSFQVSLFLGCSISLLALISMIHAEALTYIFLP